MPFLTGGVDVYVVGSAQPASGSTATRLRVEIRIGERFARPIDVFGDRVWQRGAGGLVPSDPEPFEQVPLTYAHAFGGTLPLDEGKFAYPQNPDGKGYYLSEEQAEGQPLPNLEDPAHPIASFEDRPDPVGTAPYPREWGMSMGRSIDTDFESEDFPHLTRIKPLIFNNAHPEMIIAPADAPGPGDEVSITNLTPDGELRFRLPDGELHAHVQLADRHYLFPLHLDQIGILADQGRVFLSYRTVFRYRMVPMERRMTTLYAGPLPEQVPAYYVRDWEERSWP
jgi:hypothetical protein